MIEIRRLLKHRGRGFGIAALLVLLCVALAWTHTGPASGGMGEEHMDGAMSAMCLAIAEIATVAIVGFAALVALRGNRRPPSFISRFQATSDLPIPMARIALPRAGPAWLQVFLR